MCLNIVFCWPDISGYMAACWRALAQSSNLQVFIIAFQARTETAFSEQLMAGILCHLLNLGDRQLPNIAVASLVETFPR